ncbi:MAG: hypothetical protein QXS79_05550 [Candidatus Bathyarchaeia archaeon]
MSNEEYFYTFCDACNEVPMCGIKFLSEGDLVIKVKSWLDFPMSPPCLKAYILPQIRHHPKRLLYPIMRTRNKDSPDPDGLGFHGMKPTILLSLNLRI